MIGIKVRKAESAFDLRSELFRSFPRSYRRLTERYRSKVGFTTESFMEKVDMICCHSAAKEPALILANPSGEDVFSTLSTFALLGSDLGGHSNLLAVPYLNRPQTNIRLDREVSSALERIVERWGIKKAILLGDAIPYFDSFHVAVIDEDRLRSSAHALCQYLEAKGFELGKYTVSEDSPSYPIQLTKHPVLTHLSALGVDAMGYSVTEKMEICVAALKFHIGQFRIED